ncbi:pyridoxamine 5'-phosphate oxidase family protein [Rhizobium sp. P40RR-XXII]|uniref:pyridoxamine 5'-phosphate oxidase family protein n=1 Tax=unclassified Rhizobium TaxID=2613769 RepID=UPI001456D383|nr:MULTISPECIES: pyridoxamine 5'-phosphate oxidase family protein [unclassified Rhizobium]NLR83910.1 pyridoxamine 5'-phosphate oxidase family protein [Rhizobium sp. P28RR-XV]NLS15444.1 pyridoxamine 5'-phosphate oxidase family protein [Rhizobium sp. P40RR-XXII]
MTDHYPLASDTYPTTERTRVRRSPKRGSHAHADVHAILDAAPLCHVGYVVNGAPYVTPTLHWREDDHVYWHGSAASRFLRAAEDMPVCLTCSIMDGYVLARSAFNHSVNYRSAMVFGTARLVDDLEEKTDALRRFVEDLFPGRWDSLRPMTRQEVKATSVLRMKIDEASAKIRNGPPGDMDEANHPVWAGVLPIESRLLPPQPAPGLPDGMELPQSLADLIQSGRLG